MHEQISRRRFVWLSAASAWLAHPGNLLAREAPVEWSYPMGLDGGVLGDGCGIFHGYA
jgi:hypothetical protein